MGNEMGNQNVSGLQVEEPVEPETPAKSSEAAMLSSDSDSLQVKKGTVSTSNNENVIGNGNRSSSDSANLSEKDDSPFQGQASTGRDNTATENSGNHVEILRPASNLDGGEQEKISVSPLETQDLYMEFKNSDTTNSHDTGNHQIQNDTSTGRGQEEKISMESEDKMSCDQKSSIDNFDDSSIEQSSVALVSKGDVIQSNGSCDFGEKDDETDMVEQLDRKSMSGLRDVKNDGNEDEITAEMDVSRNKTTELPSNGSLESFYLESIDSDIKGVFLGDDAQAVGMGTEVKMNEYDRGSILGFLQDDEVSVDELGSFYLDTINSEIKRVCLGDGIQATGMVAEIKMNEYGHGSTLISQKDDKVSVDKSNIDKNDMLQTDFSVIEADGEKKSNGDDEIKYFGIEKVLQVDDGRGTESGQQIKRHDSHPSLISETDAKDLDNEMEETDNSLHSSSPVTESIGEMMIKETEDADSKGEGSEGKGSYSVMKEPEPDSNLILDGGSINEEIVRSVLPQCESLKQEMALVLPSLVSLDKQQEPATENDGTEIKILEARQTLDQEGCLNVHSSETFGTSSGNSLSETSEPTPELETDESEIHPASHLKAIQFADDSLSESGDVSAISNSLSRETELSCSLTKFLGDNEQRTDYEIPGSREMSYTELNRANFDSSEMYTTDLENSLVETEASVPKTQTENLEKCLSPCKDEWVAHGIAALCETDEVNQDIQLHASESPSLEVSAPLMKNDEESPLDEENRKDQEILENQSHLNENTSFDSLPIGGKPSISALEVSPSSPEHEASASDSCEKDQEKRSIPIDLSESRESGFALPLANAEVSAVETKTEEFKLHIMLQEASIAQDEASQTMENTGKSVTASDHEEESATKHFYSKDSIDLKNQTSETELQIPKVTKNESLGAEPVEKQVFVQERSNSKKLKSPLPNSVRIETHLGEPLQKQASSPVKKTVKADWSSPKKDMAASAKGRDKAKSRYSLFSHCMCCTAVIQ